MHGGHQRVAQRVLLVQETGVGARLHVPPGAPLVHDETDLALRVPAVHDRLVARHQLLDAGRVAQREVPLLLVEAGGRALRRPAPGHCVVVQRDGLERPGAGVRRRQVVEGTHQRLGPVVVVAVRARGDPVHRVVAVVADVGGVLAGQRGELLDAQVAAAAPRLVAQSPERDPPRLVAPVLPPQGGHRGAVAAGQVLDPLGHLPHAARADVAGDVRIRAQQLAQRHELVRAEGVVLDHVAPVRVHHAGTQLARADPVAPVVVVGEAAARPAQVRDADAAQRLHHVEADPALVRGRGALPHPESAVDAAPQVLGEVAVDVAGDGGAGQVEVNDGGDGRGGHGRPWGKRPAGCGVGNDTAIGDHVDPPSRGQPAVLDRPPAALLRY